MATGVVYSHSYLNHKTSTHPVRGFHPECPERVAVIAKRLEEAHSLNLHWIEPRRADRTDILRCHSPSHYDLIEDACRQGVDSLDPDTTISSESFDVALLAAGGVLSAIDAVVNGLVENAFVVARPPGHHASFDRAQGFCLFNSVAVGARYAQLQYELERILIVDWDVHHGNGTQDIFYEDDSVFYFSLHQSPHYPGTGARTEEGEARGRGYTLNIPLPAGTPAQDYRNAFSTALELIVKKLHPDLVMISAGFDSHRDDPLGGLMLDNIDFIWMTEQLKHLAEKYAEGRLISLLEGGYNLRRLADVALDHVRALNS